MPFLILNIIPKSGIFIKKIEYRGPFFSYAINTSINLSHYPWALKLKKRELRREVVGKGSSQKKTWIMEPPQRKQFTSLCDRFTKQILRRNFSFKKVRFLLALMKKSI